MKTLPIPESISEYLELNTDSPSGLVWKKKPSSRILLGSNAGSQGSDGRWYVRFKSKRYRCYRVVYFLKQGKDLGSLVADHIYHDVNSNNIRPATVSDNSCNILPRAGGTSKFKGVSLEKRTGNWVVQICKNKIRRTIGTFTTEEAAALAYNAAALEYHGEFACLNVV
jgi:hypothetical protein